jgi:hypothetical protein
LDQNSDEFIEEAAIISFGSESCTRALPNLVDFDKAIDKIRRSGKAPKLVTPRVSQRDLESITLLLDHIVEKKMPIDIVINDWGILFYCLRHKDIFRSYLGRQLCRSLVDSPWVDNILRNEDPQIHELLEKHPFDDSNKLKLFKDWELKGIELNQVHGIEQSIFNIHSAGIKIFIHKDNYLLTAGKVCLAKKICGNKECKYICNIEFELEPTGKWLNFFKNQAEFSINEKEALSGMKVVGNKILMPYKVHPLDIISLNTGIIFTTYKRMEDM